jgi:hypothetical protein
MTSAPEAKTTEGSVSYAAMVNDAALSLTPFERQCGLLWPSYRDPALLAPHVYPEEYADHAAGEVSNTKHRAFEREAIRRVKWAINRVFAQLERHYYADVQEAAREHQRSILDAYRNRRETGRPAEAHVGVTPYGALDNDTLAERRTWDEYQAAKADPKNYRAVSLRAPLVTAAVLRPLATTERLTVLARHQSAQAELASASL